MNNILLIGLGPHARHYHFPLVRTLERDNDVRIVAIVDLRSQKESVCGYSRENNFNEDNLYFVEDGFRNDELLAEPTERLLDSLIGKYGVTHVIISTEPKAHKAYALWAATRGLSILMDKPITAPCLEVKKPESALLIKRDYDEILKAVDDNYVNLCVLSLRRYLPVILDAQSYLSEFIREFKVPVTHIAIRHGEGMWNMPDEYFYRENHPYKYGYGLLLHSGYHFVDLFLLFLKLNDLLEEKKCHTIQYSSAFTTPGDLSYTINKNDYKHFFGISYDKEFSKEKISELQDYGELDFQTILCSKNRNAVVTTGVLDLLQTSYCTRFSHILPEDTYKDNGRTTHEYISIEVGHLLNVIIERTELGRPVKDASRYDSGKSYELKIYRNSNLVGGVPFESKFYGSDIDICLGEKHYRFNSANGARIAGIYDWIYGEKGVSLLKSHGETIMLLTSFYRTMFEARADGQNIAIGEIVRNK